MSRSRKDRGDVVGGPGQSRRPRRRPGPAERVQLELDEQLRDRALADLEQQLRGVDAMRAAFRKVFGDGGAR